MGLRKQINDGVRCLKFSKDLEILEKRTHLEIKTMLNNEQ